MTDIEDILPQAQEELEASQAGWSETYNLGREAAAFIDEPETQWPAPVAQQRKLEGKPCQVVPVLPGMLQQIENDGVANLPAMQVSPVDDRSDVQTAEIFQGALRYVEARSRAAIAYARAFGSALKRGYGFYGLYTEKSNPWSDEQDVLIRSFADSSKVEYDPYFQEPDGSDADFAFYAESISERKYKKQWPGKELSSSGGWGGLATDYPLWFSDKSCVVREYWRKSSKHVTILLMSDGSVYDKEGFDTSSLQTLGISVEEEKEVDIPTVQWFKMSAKDILEEAEWELKWLPIIPVLGRERLIGGRRVFTGVVQDAMDPCRNINYITSTITEVIAFTPRNPYIAAAGQVEDFLKEWKESHRTQKAVLRYKPMTNGGQPVPTPQRQTFSAELGSLMGALQQAHQDLRDAVGVYPPQMGQPSNETSAAAIDRRVAQGQLTNANFTLNLQRSIQQGCRVALAMIRETYSIPRIARIIGEDGVASHVPVNQPYVAGQDDTGNDIVRVYDLTGGEYDIVPGVGADFRTRREDQRAGMTEFVKQNPQVSGYVMDLIADVQDWPKKKLFVDRFQKLPQVQSLLNGGPSPAEQQKDQQISELTAKVQELGSGIAEAKMRADSAEKVAEIQRASAVEVAAIKLGEQGVIATLNETLNSLTSRIDAWDAALQTLAAPSPEQGGNGGPPNGGAPPDAGGPSGAGPDMSMVGGPSGAGPEGGM